MAPAVNAAGLACGLCANEAVAISRIAPQRNTDIGTDRPSDISNNESVDGIRARVDLSVLSEKIDIHKLAHSPGPDVQLCRLIFANRAGQIRISPYAVNISQRNSLTSRDYTRGANRYSLSLPKTRSRKREWSKGAVGNQSLGPDLRRHIHANASCQSRRDLVFSD